MNRTEELFWKAQMALQSNRLNESCQYIYQAIEQFDQPKLTLEQVELIWTVIPSMYRMMLLKRASRNRRVTCRLESQTKVITTHTRSIERLVHYHQRMPMETDESFDHLTQSYVHQLERDQADRCLKLIRCFDGNLIQGQNDIDHIHLNRLQADLYLQLSYVSRPYQSQLFYNQHRKLINDNEQLMNMYRN